MYRFVDTKGFIARPQYGAVISEKELVRLKEFVHNPENGDHANVSQKDLEATKEAILLLEQLDMVPMSYIHYHQTHELNGNWLYPDLEKTPCRAVLEIDRFTTAQGQLPEHFPQHERQWGWEQGVALLPLQKSLVKVLNEMVVKSGKMRKIEFSEKILKRVEKHYTQLQQGVMTHQVFDPKVDLVQADAFAIYIGGKNAGFLDGRDGTAPLAGARLFESQASAEKTIQSRGLQNVAVVCIKAQMTGLAPNQKIQGDISELKEAIASVEKKQIMDALNMASSEQLEQAVSTRKKRM